MLNPQGWHARPSGSLHPKTPWGLCGLLVAAWMALIMASPALAQTVSFLVGGSELTAGAPGSSHIGVLRIQMAGAAQSVVADASSFYPGPRGYGALQASCTHDEADDSLLCLISDLELYIGRPPEFPLAITVTALDGTATSLQAALHISLDESHPRVSALATNHCQAPPCYVHPGLNTVRATIADSGSPLGNYPIVLALDTRQAMAACEGMVCTAEITIPNCGQGTTMAAFLSEGRNNAGAQIQGQSLPVRCDASPPSLVGDVELVTTPDNFRFYHAGQAVAAKAKVVEADSKAFITLDLSAQGGGVTTSPCTASSNDLTTFTCSSPGTLGPSTGPSQATIIVSDGAGNGIEQVLDFEVLEAAPTARQNWGEPAQENSYYSPRSINAVHTNVVPTRVMVEIPFPPQFPGITLLGGKATCPAPVKSTQVQASGHSLLLGLTLDKQEYGGDILEVDCTLVLSTREGRTLFDGESHQVHVAIPLHRSASLGQLAEEMVKQQERSINNNAQKFDKFKAAALGYRKYCQTIQTVATAGASAAAVGQVLSLLPEPFEQAATPVNSLSQDLGFVNDRNWNAYGPGCHWFLCNDAENRLFGLVGDNPYTDFMQGLTDLPHMDTLIKVAGYPEGTSYADLASYKNSFLGGFLSGCIPSMINAYQRLNAINCEYVTCLRRDFQAGGYPVGQCGKAKSFMTCKYWLGEVFNVLPYVGVAKEISQKYHQILRNPVALLGAMHAALCTIQAVRNSAWSLCLIPSHADSIQNARKIVDAFRRGEEWFGDDALDRVNAPCTKLMQATGNLQHAWDVPNYLAVWRDTGNDVVCTSRLCKKDDWAADTKGNLYYKDARIDRKKLEALRDKGTPIEDKDSPFKDWTQDQARELFTERGDLGKVIYTEARYRGINADLFLDQPEFADYKRAVGEKTEADKKKTEADTAYQKARTDALERERQAAVGRHLDRVNRERVEIERRNQELASGHGAGWPPEGCTDGDCRRYRNNQDEVAKRNEEYNKLFKESAKQGSGGIPREAARQIERESRKNADKDESVKDAKKKLKDAAKEAKNKEKEARAAAADALRSERLDAIFDNGWGTYSVVLDYALLLSNIKFAQGSAFHTWQTFVDSKLAKTFNIEYWESHFCSKTRDLPAGTAFANYGGGLISTAAHIEAEAARTFTEDGDPVIRYFVTAYVQPRSDEASYRIMLSDPEDHIFLSPEPNAVPDRRGPFRAPGNQALVLEDTRAFGHACIEFAENIRNYFDYYGDLHDNRLCSPVQWVGE